MGKQLRSDEQTEKVIDLILKDKRLKVSKCDEFLPSLPNPSVKSIPLGIGKPITSGNIVSWNINQNDPKLKDRLPDDKTIYYSRVEVQMICFINIAFHELKTSPHQKEYGKFGLVFDSNFLKRQGIKEVQYYSEDSLWTDPLIVRWNKYQWNNAIQSMNGNKANLIPDSEIKTLQEEILTYRKPASLFPSFRKSIQLKLTYEGNCFTSAETFTYNRYGENYDFKKEREYRIAFDAGTEYMPFNESDLFMVIVPDNKSKYVIEAFTKTWSVQPHIELYPEI